MAEEGETRAPGRLDPELLARYVRGDCSLPEQRRVRDWAAVSPANARELAALRVVWETGAQIRTDAMPGTIDPRSAAARIRERIERQGLSAHATTRVSISPRRASWRLDRWVAGLAATLTLAIALYATKQVSGLGSAAQPFREFTTPSGGRATVTLRDGTRLVLGPATRLRVPSEFGRNDRTVELDGQAYFAVVHDPRHPFAVQTTRAIVRDVGTAFVVRAYRDDADERVAVAEGRVDLRPAGAVFAPANRSEGAALGRGDVAIVDDHHVAVTRGTDVAAYLAWMQGRLVFDRTPMADAARELSRVFDLSITVADTGLSRERVTAAYDDETADQVLEDMTRAAGAVYERTGRTVVIRRRVAGAIQRPPVPASPIATVQAASSSHE